MKKWMVRAIAPLLLVCMSGGLAAAEALRKSDKETKGTISDLQKSLSKFTKAADSSGRKSITTAEGDIALNTYLKGLKDNCAALKSNFAPDYAATVEAKMCLGQAHALEDAAQSGGGVFGAPAEWTTLRSDLVTLSAAYGVDWETSPDTWSVRRMNDVDITGALDVLADHLANFRQDLKSAYKSSDVSAEDRKAVMDAIDQLDWSITDLKMSVERGAASEKAIEAMNSSFDQIGNAFSDEALASKVAPSWGPVAATLSKLRRAFPTA